VSGEGYHGAAIRSAARPFGDPGETFRRQSCEEPESHHENLAGASIGVIVSPLDMTRGKRRLKWLCAAFFMVSLLAG